MWTGIRYLDTSSNPRGSDVIAWEDGGWRARFSRVLKKILSREEPVVVMDSFAV